MKRVKQVGLEFLIYMGGEQHLKENFQQELYFEKSSIWRQHCDPVLLLAMAKPKAGRVGELNKPTQILAGGERNKASYLTGSVEF